MTATIEAPPVTETLAEPGDGLQTPCPHIVELFNGARFYCTTPPAKHVSPRQHRCELPAVVGHKAPARSLISAHAVACVVVTWEA